MGGGFQSRSFFLDPAKVAKTQKWISADYAPLKEEERERGGGKMNLGLHSTRPQRRSSSATPHPNPARGGGGEGEGGPLAGDLSYLAI